MCSIESVYHQAIETLSKGYRRRVGLAQALIHDPQVLILDEPTDGLDPNQKHEVRQLIGKMAKEKCIIISTHILEEVEADLRQDDNHCQGENSGGFDAGKASPAIQLLAR